MLGFGLGVTWVGFALTAYGPTLGYGWTFVLAVMLGVSASVVLLGLVAALFAISPGVVGTLRWRHHGARRRSWRA